MKIPSVRVAAKKGIQRNVLYFRLKPLVVRRPKGVKPQMVRRPKGVKPLSVRRSKGVKPQMVRRPKGVTLGILLKEISKILVKRSSRELLVTHAYLLFSGIRDMLCNWFKLKELSKIIHGIFLKEISKILVKRSSLELLVLLLMNIYFLAEFVMCFAIVSSQKN